LYAAADLVFGGDLTSDSPATATADATVPTDPDLTPIPSPAPEPFSGDQGVSTATATADATVPTDPDLTPIPSPAPEPSSGDRGVITDLFPDAGAATTSDTAPPVTVSNLPNAAPSTMHSALLTAFSAAVIAFVTLAV
jgi:hypothetical protein